MWDTSIIKYLCVRSAFYCGKNLFGNYNRGGVCNNVWETGTLNFELFMTFFRTFKGKMETTGFLLPQ